MTPTRRYFDRHARSFDRVAAGRSPAALLRRGPRRGRELAVTVVSRSGAPTVLDVGCGPGRVAEAVLDAGAAAYTGIDLSSHMLELARRRVEGYPFVELIQGDFLALPLRRSFDVVLALGLFDYLEQPARAAAWLHAHCSSTLVASFTRWDWLKGPLRHAHYGLHRCPVYDYTPAIAKEILLGAGFSRIEFASRGRRGFHVLAAA